LSIFNFTITTLEASIPTKIDKERKRILELKARSRKVADKGKHTEEYIMETSLKEYREKKLMELQYMLE
jgi:hypothetical protein